MQGTKWYVKLLYIIVVIVFSPLILIVLLIFALCMLFSIPAEKKAFHKSAYYRNLQLPFRVGILSDMTYRFYNAAVERNLNIQFHKQQNDIPDYFIYQDTRYILPWFFQMEFSKEKNRWEIEYDSDWCDLNDEYTKNTETLKQVNPEIHTCVLVERACIYNESLEGLVIPDFLHIVSTYETAFENDENVLDIKYPENTDDLYLMMCEAQEISGTFQLSGDSIIWNLNSDFHLKLSGTQFDWCIELYKGKRNITHWHPEITEIVDEVFNIGAKGNVLIVRDSFIGKSVLYMGKLSECPYPENLKWKWGKIYYIIPD